MLTFIAGGVINFEPSNLTPLFPSGEGEPFAEGFAPFLLAVVLLYIPFQGFGMIIEIGEELENPVENIPKVLAIGMGFVTVLSVAIVVALVGAVPWEETINPETGEAVEGGLATVMMGRVPAWTVAVIAVGALVAAATTVNTLFTSYSRTVMRAARDEVVPDYFAAIHDRFHTPHRSILLLGVPPILAAPFTGYLNELVAVEFLDWLIVVVVTSIFVAFMIGGVALWNLPKVFPGRYEYSFYRLPMPVLKVVAVGNVVVSFVLCCLSPPARLLVSRSYSGGWFWGLSSTSHASGTTKKGASTCARGWLFCTNTNRSAVGLGLGLGQGQGQGQDRVRRRRVRREQPIE